uniref:Uncharacterized protein n=2 Tax=Anguilla anguilla TaxID=7936 RepID=A0A0E9TVL9_ANGAN
MLAKIVGVQHPGCMDPQIILAKQYKSYVTLVGYLVPEKMLPCIVHKLSQGSKEELMGCPASKEKFSFSKVNHID